MKSIGKDQDMFDRLTSDIYIISSSIKQFNIFVTGADELVIEIDFELLYKPGAVLKLRFVRIKEYSFYWNSAYNFYYVKALKLMKKEDLFYVSFDPEDDTSFEISEKDQDFILFGGFEGYYTEGAANLI